MSTLSDCREIEFPVIPDPAGDLTVIEGEGAIPFAIRRVFYLYKVPEGARRGGHAHRKVEQVLIAVAGRFEVLLDDAKEQRSVRLDDPSVGLYLPRMIWRELTDFSAGAVCLVLASRPYEEAEYIRDHGEFVASREA